MTYADVRERAVRWGRLQVTHPSPPARDDGKPLWSGWCQMFTRMSLGAPGGARDAKAQWLSSDKRNRHKLTDTTPAGVPIYFKGGTHWHAAIYTGLKDGTPMCLSTDIKRRGKVDEVPVMMIVDRWDYPLLGWLSVVNRKRIQGKKLPGER